VLTAASSRKRGIRGSRGTLIEDLDGTATAPRTGGGGDVIVADQSDRK
jgi:hypothetical protein